MPDHCLLRLSCIAFLEGLQNLDMLCQDLLCASCILEGVDAHEVDLVPKVLKYRFQPLVIHPRSEKDVKLPVGFNESLIVISGCLRLLLLNEAVQLRQVIGCEPFPDCLSDISLNNLPYFENLPDLLDGNLSRNVLAIGNHNLKKENS